MEKSTDRKIKIPRTPAQIAKRYQLELRWCIMVLMDDEKCKNCDGLEEAADEERERRKALQVDVYCLAERVEKLEAEAADILASDGKRRSPHAWAWWEAVGRLEATRRAAESCMKTGGHLGFRVQSAFMTIAALSRGVRVGGVDW